MRQHYKLERLALSFALCAAANALGQTPNFTMIDFPGAVSTQTWGIGPQGDVIGFYGSADKSTHGFILSGGKYTPIDFPGAAVTLVNGIGPRGELVGEYGTTLTSPHHGFVLSSQGVFTPIDYPGATATYGIGIDARGDIVGIYALADNVNHGFILSADHYTSIDVPGSANTGINGISLQGDVVGGYSGGGVVHGFVMSNGKISTLDFAGSTYTTATGANTSGDVVGRYTSGGVNHGYVFSGGKYTTIDFPNATFTGVTSINAAGSIVGRCTVGGVTHGFLMSAARPATRYNITDLGPVGGPPAQPYVMADNGLLSGAATADDGTLHAVLWRNRVKSDLGTPGLGGMNSIGLAVNNSGQAVGSAESTTPDSSGEDFCAFKADGFPTQGTKCLPFLWQYGVMTPLPTLGGLNGQASWINNRSEIVGTAENFKLDPACVSPQKYQFKPVIWEKGLIHELPTFGTDVNGYAFSINDSGQAVGASGECSGLQGNGTFLQARHALLWQTGGVMDMGTLGGTGTGAGIFALGINNQGQAVGASDLAGDETFHGFVWSRATGMQDIGTLPGDVASGALGINDPGEIIGASFDKDFSPRAIVRQPGGVVTDLNTLIPADSPLFLLFGCSINSSGKIAGVGVNDAGEAHAFLATPTNASDNESSGLMLQGGRKRVVLPEAARKQLQRQLRFGGLLKRQ